MFLRRPDHRRNFNVIMLKSLKTAGGLKTKKRCGKPYKALKTWFSTPSIKVYHITTSHNIDLLNDIF